MSANDRSYATNLMNLLDGYLTAGTGDGAQIFTLTVTEDDGETLTAIIDGKVYEAAATAAAGTSATALAAVLNAAAEFAAAFTLVDSTAGVLTITSRVSGKKHVITGSGSSGSNVVVTDDADLNVDGSATAVIGKLAPVGTEVFLITEINLFLEDADVETGEFGTAAALVHGLHLYVATGAGENPIQTFGTIKKNSDLAKMGGALYLERAIGTAVEAVLGQINLRDNPIFLFADNSDSLNCQIYETMATLTDLRIQVKGYRGANATVVMGMFKQFVNNG